MKAHFAKTLVAAVLVFSFYACMKCDPYTESCKLVTATHSTKNAGIVTYRVQDSGAVFVKSFTYHGPDGLVTVENPVLPFTVSFPVTQAANIGITAEGTAMNGHFSIEYIFSTSTDTITQKDICRK
jgi:hypothetical protein